MKVNTVTRNVIPAVLWVAFALWALYEARGFGLGEPTAPGPGMLPAMLAAAIIGLAVWQVFSELLSKRQRADATEETVVPAENLPGSDAVTATVDAVDQAPGKFTWRLPILLCLLLLYAFALSPLGFIVSTLAFLIIVAGLLEQCRIRSTLFVAVLTTGFLYSVIVLLLKAPLPQGFWSI